MGGMGSGGHNRRYFATVEELPKLSLQMIQKAGALQAGSSRVWRWRLGAEEMASIVVRGAEMGVRLHYSVTGSDGARAIDDPVSVRWRSCPFGGVRPFFICPRCGRSVLNLHLASAHFICLRCAGLTYATRRERPQARHLRAANRLRQKLGGEPGVQSAYARPRGMRRATYLRIVTEIERREGLAFDELAGFVAGLKAKSARTPPARFCG